jgi:RND family efflux transporter MFP subunit
MRNVFFGVVAAVAVAAGAWYYWAGSQETAAASANPSGTAAGGGAGRGGRGRGATMAVEVGNASRRELVDYITVVGNLIGEATVDVVPRVAGRLDSVQVQLGDRVSRGQQVAKVEDRELREQVNQSEANIQVNRATVTARENDLQVAASALDRAKTSFERGLISKQGLEDAEARYNAAQSQLDVAKAQLTSTQARLDELKINLANTVLVAPMDGVVSKRNLDPGAFAGGNTVVLSLVDIGTVRLIANLVERDFKRVEPGGQALVEVDAFPGEQFRGRVKRVAPVFDPATRTATMEIEIPNPGFRLKPGMYARVRLMADSKPDALAVPRNAVVDVGGKRGVYLLDGDVARFQAVETGLSDGDFIEIVGGIEEGARLVTVGALALRDGERVSVIGAGGRGGREGGAGAGRQGGGAGSRQGGARGQQQEPSPAAAR